MQRQNSNYCTKPHGLFFEIEGVKFTVDEVGRWAAGIVNFDSESDEELFSRDVAHEVCIQVARKVKMGRAQAEHARVRREWIKLHPPNHAGFYYCHVGGEWVHINSADLEHTTPGSVERINTDEPGWDEKLRMACRPHNYLKGSRQDVKSTTLEFSPPDEAC